MSLSNIFIMKKKLLSFLAGGMLLSVIGLNVSMLKEGSDNNSESLSIFIKNAYAGVEGTTTYCDWADVTCATLVTVTLTNWWGGSYTQSVPCGDAYEVCQASDDATSDQCTCGSTKGQDCGH
jgi:hypothetical protein